jgi:hypothetical protein
MHFSIGKQTHNLQKTDHYKTLPFKGNNTATAENISQQTLPFNCSTKPLIQHPDLQALSFK